MGHLRDIDETYMEHFRHAIEIGAILLFSSVAQIVHAVCPNFAPPLGSDVESLIHFLESKRPSSR